MKTKTIMLSAFILFGAGFLNAQDFKIAKSTGTLDIKEVNHLSVEGYDGNEIVFRSNRGNDDEDGRSKGLRAVTSSGLEDNTGIGISVIDKGGIIEVRQLKKMDGPNVTIMVPKGVAIDYSHSSPYGDDVSFKNIEGNLQVSTVHNQVFLTNITGTINVKTIHGDVEATFGAALKNTVNLSSVHGHVDVAFPVATKATLKLSTSFGEILVDPDFKIEIEHTGNMIKYSDNVSGKINGGGVEVSLSSQHNNVYLRKK